MACQAPIQQEQSKEKVFFDLKQYFNKTIENLEQSSSVLDKTVKIGTQTETKILQEVDWAQELQVFVDADINKTAWMDKYDKDTVGQRISYIANDPSLKTQKVILDFLNVGYMAENLDKVTIENQTNNVLYQSQETLTYLSLQNQWVIRRTQKVATGNAEIIEIEGKVNK